MEGAKPQAIHNTSEAIFAKHHPKKAQSRQKKVIHGQFILHQLAAILIGLYAKGCNHGEKKGFSPMLRLPPKNKQLLPEFPGILFINGKNAL